MRRAAGLAVIAIVLTIATPAHGDGAEHSHQPVLEGFDVPLPRVTAELRAFPAPTVVVRNASTTALEVLDEDGDAFLRIGPDVIEANVAEPAFYASEAPSPEASVPPSADGGAPRWVRLVDGGDWAWFEHRIAATPVTDTWSIPIRYGDKTLALTGAWEAIEVPARVDSRVHDPEVDGLDVQILPGTAPGLFVGNDTGKVLEIPTERGEKFLRIGPDRTERATPDGGWEVVAPTPRYGWVDARVGWQAEAPAGGSTREWLIPATLGGEALHLEGEVEWVPLAGAEPADDDDGIPVLGLTLSVALPVAAGLLLARRQAKRT